MSQLPSFNPPLRGKSKIKYGDHGVAAALEFVELSARVQVPLIPQILSEVKMKEVKPLSSEKNSPGRGCFVVIYLFPFVQAYLEHDFLVFAENFQIKVFADFAFLQDIFQGAFCANFNTLDF